MCIQTARTQTTTEGNQGKALLHVPSVWNRNGRTELELFRMWAYWDKLTYSIETAEQICNISEFVPSRTKIHI